MFP
jgi:tetratricopeptide (TPR) repeat protein